MKYNIFTVKYLLLILISIVVIYKITLVTPPPTFLYVNIPSPLISPVIQDKQNVLFGIENGFFYNLKNNGDIVWKNILNDIVFHKPLISKDSIYLSNFDGKIYIINRYSGEKTKEILINDYITPDTSPIVYNNKIYVGARDGYVYCFDLNTKNLIWKFQANQIDISHLKQDERPYHFGTFSLEKNILYVNSSAGKFYSLNSEDGSLKWSYSSYAFSNDAPIVYKKFIIIRDAKGKLVVLDKITGELLWQTSITYVPEKQTYFDDEMYMYVFSNGEFARYNLQNGEKNILDDNFNYFIYQNHLLFAENNVILQRIEIGNSGLISSVNKFTGKINWTYKCPEIITSSIRVGKMIISSCFNGTISAINMDSGEKIWNYVAFGKPSNIFLYENTVMIPTETRGHTNELTAINISDGSIVNKVNLNQIVNPQWVNTLDYLIAIDTDRQKFVVVNKALFNTKKVDLKTIHLLPDYSEPFTNKLKQLLHLQNNVHIDQQQKSVGLGDIFELGINYVNADIYNPWEDISVEGKFTHEQEVVDVKGYYFDTNVWKINFVPNKTGIWKWNIQLKTKNSVIEKKGDFQVNNSTNEGFLKLDSSKTFPFTYEFSNKPFIGVGLQDLLNDYNFDGDPLNQFGNGNPPTKNTDIHYATFSAYLDYYQKGFNLYRWGPGNASFKLDKYLSPETNWYGINEGIFIDKFVRNLKEKKFKLMMSLFCFQVPYEGKLDAGIKKSLNRYLDNIIARYSAYVDIWEIFNEAEVTTEWMDYVTSYIKRIDPYQHPITTNWEQPTHNQISINSLHWYDNGPLSNTDILTSNKVQSAKIWKKPVLFSEVGNIDASWDEESAERMRIKTWTAFFNQAILIYWNDPRSLFLHKESANIYLGDTEVKYMKIFREFTSDISSDITPTQILTVNPVIRSYTVLSNKSIYGYLVNSQDKTTNVNTMIAFTSEYNGSITWISPETGNSIQTDKIEKGNNNIESPSFNIDIAYKITSE